jgi:thymidylate synthase ThyX
MTRPTATIITGEPIVAPIGQMALIPEGILTMAEWIKKYRPDCVPEGGFSNVYDLLPHDGYDDDPFLELTGGSTAPQRKVTDNELLAELAGRKCYDSFADAGKKRTNNEYLHSMWDGRIPHRSTGYHAQMSFFIAHVSRRVSHELIRNYVGHAKDEEGIPSQESTRFTHHPGIYIVHPNNLAPNSFDNEEIERFQVRAQANYEDYVETIQRKIAKYKTMKGEAPKGLDKKRIYESSSGDLLMSCGTSFIWTTNPMAMTKFFHERHDEAADMEMCRFAATWKKVCFQWWPNLFTDFHPKR